ncbi:MAG: lipid II:glycine glycyltransferase FemX, partial [Candidatus Limnocylindrales bacterium]
MLADDRAWDAFVASVPSGGYTQLTAWAEVKAVNGWTARRIAVPAVTGLAAGQMLLHRLGPSPWSVGYLPRGPIAAAWDREAAVALTAAVRTMAARLRLSHVTIEPPIPAGDVLEGWLREAGWQPGIAIQPARTRIVDLERSEAELWADLRSKWRQYVGSAGRAGVVAAETGREGLAEFARIYHETATRGGFLPRAASALESVYEAFAARDAARLLIARMPGGEAVAGLMLLSCGRGVVEPYGGMTAAGAESHA